MNKKQKPTFIDLFSGAGGFTDGFEKAGFEALFAVDNWNAAAATYQHNHSKTKFFEQDIRTVRPLKILEGMNFSKNEVDAVVGGPPCQGFSMAGKRSVGDPRNGLFREFIRIIQEIQPKFLVMENVKGLLSMKTQSGEKVINVIEEEFNKIGYNVSCHILNAAEYGVPQRRERVIFIANSLGLHNGILFPRKTHGPDSRSKKPFVTVREAIMGIASVSDPEDKWNHKPMAHNEEVRKRFELIPLNGDLAKDQSFLPESLRRQAYAFNCKRLALDEPSVTLIPGHYAFPIHPTLPRTITVREAARLQTFSDKRIFFGKRDSQALLVGNAIPPILAESIAVKLKSYL